MSVIINGMNMPETCILCPCQFGGYCYVAPADIEEPKVAKSPFEVEGRPEWCPIEELSWEAEVAQNVHNKYRCKCGNVFMPSNDIEKIEFVCQNCGAKMNGGEDDGR